MEKSTQWSRRKFVAQLSGAGALLFLNPMQSWMPQLIDPKIADIVAKTIGIDTHNHVDVPLVLSELPGPKLDLSAEMKKSGLSSIVMTFAVDYQKLPNPDDGYNRFLAGLDAMDQVLKLNDMKRAFSVSDIISAHKNKQPIVIQSVEGAHFFDGKIERLNIAYDRGLRHLCLLHDNDASVPLGDVFTNPPKINGLSAFGKEVVKACNKKGILIDMSHASDDTLNAALELSTKPILVSHTGLDTRLGNNEMMAKMMRPRLISATQAKRVAEAKGAIGVWTHLAETPLEYAENIRAMVDVAGIDHVCIGTDTKLTPAYRSPSDSRPGPQNPRPGERTNFAWASQTEGFYYVMVEALLKVGFSENDIAKIGGGNYLRLFEAATS